MPEIHLDFETCSEIDLRDVGVYAYVTHPSTRIICASFRLPGEEIVTWDEIQPHNTIVPLVEAVSQGATVHGWNVAFERYVWNHVFRVKYRPSSPFLRPDQTYDTMAAAACAGLPMDLQTASEVVNAGKLKDAKGHATMLRMARPRGFKPDGSPRWWHVEDAAKLAELRAYNADDVAAEEAISKTIPPMTHDERRIWLLDQRMNDRGLPVDHDLLDRLSTLTLSEKTRLDQALATLTQGEVTTVQNHGRLLQWLSARGYPLGSVAKDAVTMALSFAPGRLHDEVVKALEIRAEASKSSTAKLKRIRAFASGPDRRARFLTQYGGAVRTLRWAGRGPQVQNFPRPTIKPVKNATQLILEGADAETLAFAYGSPLDVIASLLRGVFRAPDGKRLAVCDFSGIEARVLAWLAGHAKLIEVFRRGDDVYVFMANSIGSNSRQLGKIIVLALGYGMSAPKFVETAASYNVVLTLDEAEEIVSGYRAENVEIPRFWWACQDAAIQAIQNPDKRFTVGGGDRPEIVFRMAKFTGKLSGSLLIRLPSGRHLVYRNACLMPGKFSRPQVVYDGENDVSQWGQIRTYGGKFAENITQAVARDLLAYALLDLADAWDDALLVTIHDEIIGMTGDNEAPFLFDAMKQAMSKPPAWGAGLPLNAAGDVVERYGKIG